MANSLLFLALINIDEYPDELTHEIRSGTIERIKTKEPGVEILDIDQYIALYNEDKFSMDNTFLFRII